MKQITLAFIKPDAFERREEIKAIYLERGLEIIAEKKLRMGKELAEEFYKEHRGSPHFGPNIVHNTSGSILAMIICGEDAIYRVRKINGATDPDKAEKGTLRWEYGTHNVVGPINPKNAVHASDSAENARREIRLLFGEKYCSSV